MEGKDRSDEELVVAFQQGEQEAFEILFKRYYLKIYRYILGYVRNHHDAEDITQNVFLAVYIALPRFHPEGEHSFERWITRIATNAVINFLKKRDNLKWEPLYEMDEEGEEYPIEIQDMGPTPQNQIEKGELESEIRKIIESLPPKQRQVVKYRILEGLSLEEISKKMECALGTVKAHLYNGLERIRKILLEKGFTL